MKCSNCGKEEVNFYYESNVNGKVTRQQLCAECAQKLGFGTDSFFEETNSVFENMLSDFSDFFGTRRRFGGFAMPALMRPSLLMPRIEVRFPEEKEQCKCGKCTQQEQAPSDAEMDKRRRMNILRDKMQKAVAEERFEDAAKIRDELHSMEKGE